MSPRKQGAGDVGWAKAPQARAHRGSTTNRHPRGHGRSAALAILRSPFRGHDERRARRSVGARALHLIPSDPPPLKGRFRGPFFFLRERRATTFANNPRTAAKAFALRFEDRRVSLAQMRQQIDSRWRRCRDSDGQWLPENHHRRPPVRSTSAGLAIQDRQMVLGLH
jgi:hypothetical protein